MRAAFEYKCETVVRVVSRDGNTFLLQSNEQPGCGTRK